MFLLDTNIFLEMLLAQDKQEDCRKFILNNSQKCFFSDFTLYSIGIALFRKKLFDEYSTFYNDITSIVRMISLPAQLQNQLTSSARKLKLDYDDAYQYEVAKHYDLKIVTMDKDFKAVKDVSVLFL